MFLVFKFNFINHLKHVKGPYFGKLRKHFGKHGEFKIENHALIKDGK